MLDFHASTRTVAGIEVARDESAETVFFVLPPPPRVARDAEAAPAVELLRFVRDGRLTGGHLHLAVELAHSPERLAEAARLLTETLRVDAVELRPAPVLEAAADLQFVGRELTEAGMPGPWTSRGYGSVRAHAGAPHRASFSIGLTPDGVRLLEAALRSGGAPIGVVYRLRVEGLWPAQRVLARVDWGRAYEHFSRHSRHGSFLTVEDIRRIRETLVETKAVTIHAVSGLVAEDGEPAVDLGPSLAWIERHLVERFCEPILPLAREPAGASLGTVGEIFGVGAAFAVKHLTQIEQGHAEVDLQQTRVLVRTLTAHAHLQDLLGQSPADAHIGDAQPDHPFFRRMQLHVETAKPLVESHLEEALLQFTYGTGRTSVRITADSPEAAFEAWADAAADGRWTLLPEVTFAAAAPVRAGERLSFDPIAGTSRELLLDLDRLLGLRRIAIQGPSDDRVAVTRVTLAHRRGEDWRTDHQVRLVGAGAAHEAWLADVRSGDRIEADVEYLLRDGRRLTSGSLVVDTEVLRLPPPFPGRMTVQLLADDDWSDLDRVVVAVQKAEDQPAGTFEFTEAGQLVPVNLDLPDPTDRTYRYRATRTWSSGLIEEEDAWAVTDASVLVVGRVAATVLVVDLQPVGPDLPDAGIHLIQVELLYVDVEHQIRQTATELIRARADRPRWRIPLADPSRREYEYRITVHRLTGSRDVGPWTTSRERILPIPVTAA